METEPEPNDQEAIKRAADREWARNQYRILRTKQVRHDQDRNKPRNRRRTLVARLTRTGIIQRMQDTTGCSYKEAEQALDNWSAATVPWLESMAASIPENCKAELWLPNWGKLTITNEIRGSLWSQVSQRMGKPPKAPRVRIEFSGALQLRQTVFRSNQAQSHKVKDPYRAWGKWQKDGKALK
jgi:hypothetical protein